jgi:type IV secretory pathway VirB2 component (pilin)
MPNQTEVQPSRNEWVWALGICLAVALLIVAPFFVLGIASGHDFEFHAASWLDAAGQWKEGILFPRWTEWANYGFGEPRFIFYPPLSWILGAALGSVMPWNAAPVVFIVLVQTIAGLCAFALGRAVTSRGGALFGAVCYAANPYALLVIYMRSDFAEQLGTAFFPLLLLLGLRVSGILNETPEEPRYGSDPGRTVRPNPVGAHLQNQNRDMAWFAVVFAVVWLANAPAGVMASYALALAFAWASLSARSFVPGLRGAAGLALGLGLAAFYLVPAAYEQRWVSIEQALASGLQPGQNFLFTAIDDPEHTWFNWIASGVAILLVVVTGTAALLGHGKAAETKPASTREQQESVWGAMLVLAAAGTLLMLRITNIFWSLLPKLRFVQFPWRWMCVVAVGYAFFLACAFGRSRRRWILITAMAALSVGIARELVQQTWWDSEDVPTLRAAIASGTGFDGTDEYDPRGDDHYDLPGKSPATTVLSAEEDDGVTPKAEVRIETWTAREKRLRVLSPRPARIALRLLDYPAWLVEVNGRRIVPQHAEDTAQMVVPIGAGNSELRVVFVRTWDRTLGITVTLVSAAIAIGMLAWKLHGAREIQGT